MKIRNNTAPRTEPCGSVLGEIGKYLELYPLTETYYYLFFKD